MASNLQHVTGFIHKEDMSSDIISRPINIQHQDICSFQYVWEGTPEGEILIELSNDGETWTSVDLLVEQPSGSSGSAIIEIETSVIFARASYIAESGAGVLSVHYCGKLIG